MVTVSKNKYLFRQRFLILLIAFAVLLIAAFVVFQYRREKYFKAEQLNSSLQLLNIQIKESLKKGVSPENFYEKHSGYFDGLRITLINDSGNVIYDSKGIYGNHKGRPEIEDAVLNGKGYTVRRLSKSTNEEYFYSALYSEGIVIRSALPYSVKLKDMLRSDYHFLWFIFGVIMVIFVFAYYVIMLYMKLGKAAEDLEREHDMALHQEQEKIRIKKQLTNNINHELKTPVSSISGYLETILSNPGMDKNTERSFIEKSFKQTRRLENLLKDVSIITRMDEACEMFEMEDVCLNSIIEEIESDMELRSAEERLRINCNLDKDFIVRGNYYLLYSVFKNLADNAAAYSGGRDIFINFIGEYRGMYYFSFADNGTGIDESHLDYIFERFYRVDKGRSRKMGGTGLGLSIVKNAVLMHGGTITARNREEGGLEFLFSICRHI